MWMYNRKYFNYYMNYRLQKKIITLLGVSRLRVVKW